MQKTIVPLAEVREYIIVRTLKNDEEFWLSFSPSEARLKNPNAERTQSHSLAFGICEASIHKLAKAQGCFEGSKQ